MRASWGGKHRGKWHKYLFVQKKVPRLAPWRPASRAREKEAFRSEQVMEKPDPFDKHAGSRLRMQRLVRGMTQTAVGHSLGISFQQIQKYETGRNRISASRMHDLASLLGVAPDFFLEGATGKLTKGDASSPSYVMEFFATSDGVALAKAFVSIKNRKTRLRIVDLVEKLCD
jgi:transcriptional regulator with XRE-family HTH domain